MTRVSNTRTRMNIYLTKELKSKLQDRADKKNYTMNKTITDALEFYVSNDKFERLLLAMTKLPKEEAKKLKQILSIISK